MDRDLARTNGGGAGIPVVLDDPDEASGLAHMLQQFVEQTLAASPEKRRMARRLRGEATFRTAEDRAVCVSIRFRGERVELSDGEGAASARAAAVTADFLSIAHLASGKASPLALLARGKLQARFRPTQLPFLLHLLRFMRTSERPRSALPARRLWLAAALGIGAVALAWLILS